MPLTSRVIALSVLLAATLSCARGNHAPAASRSAPAWVHAYEAAFFARAMDVSCAPPGSKAGVEGCIALVRYWGAMDGFDQTLNGQYGSIAFVRTDAKGAVIWSDTLMRAFDPIAQQFGAFVDDDLRVQLLSSGEFLVSGTYEGRVFIGRPGGPGSNNQELGPSNDRNLFMIEFHADGSFDNWEDTGNGLELHALATAWLPNTNIVIAGTCQGKVPLDKGSFPCGTNTDGYLLTVHYDGSTVGALTFGGARPAVAEDVVTDTAGDLFVSGSFENEMQVGSDPPDLAAGEDDGFLLKLGPDGKRAWIVAAGSIGHDRGGRLARVQGGVLWTARVSSGARVGKVLIREAGHVVARVDDSGNVSWAIAVPDAQAASAPLGVAAAEDGSFALYGEGFLGRFAADGTRLWTRTGADVRGAAFTPDALVVAATVVGASVFDAAIAAKEDDKVRAAVLALPR